MEVKLVLNFFEGQFGNYVPNAFSTCIPFDSAKSLEICPKVVKDKEKSVWGWGGAEIIPKYPSAEMEYDYMCLKRNVL